MIFLLTILDKINTRFCEIWIDSVNLSCLKLIINFHPSYPRSIANYLSNSKSITNPSFRDYK